MSGYLDGGAESIAPSLTRFSLNTGYGFTGCWAIAGIACLLTLPCKRTAAETALTKLRHEARELLKREAVLDDGLAKDAALAALCDFYVVLRSDHRYETSNMLQGDAAKVRRRLLGAARQREARLKRSGVERPASLSSTVDAAIATALADEQTDLKDLMEPGGQGGGGLPDTGWQLVELLQRVVAPDFWDRQGGPGTIRYFAMRRVLVVRATTDVHEQIKDLLMALR